MDIEVLLGWMWEQTSRLRKEGGRECGADDGDRYVVLYGSALMGFIRGVELGKDSDFSMRK